MATILSVANDIFDETGLPTLTSVATETGQQARRMIASMHAAGRGLAKWDWSRLQVLVTISSSLTTDFGLPSDFKSIVPTTIWNLTQGWQARGPVRADEYQELEGGLVTVGIYDTWRIQLSGTSQVIRVIPAPGTAELFSYMYNSKNWIVNTSTSVTGSKILSDADYPLIDDDLFRLETHWRFLKNIGQPYAEEREEAERARRIALAHDGGMQEIYAGYHDDEFYTFPAFSPDTSVNL